MCVSYSKIFTTCDDGTRKFTKMIYDENDVCSDRFILTIIFTNPLSNYKTLRFHDTQLNVTFICKKSWKSIISSFEICLRVLRVNLFAHLSKFSYEYGYTTLNWGFFPKMNSIKYSIFCYIYCFLVRSQVGKESIHKIH